MRVTRRTRQGRRGQVLVVTAIMAMVLFGGMALAVDVGLLTNDQKSMQNISDTAALSGVGDIPGSATLQTQAARDALYAVWQNFKGAHGSANLGAGDWSSEPSAWTGSSSPANMCTGSGQYCTLQTFNSVSVWIATPPEAITAAGVVTTGTCFATGSPTGPRDSSHVSTNYLEVDVCQRISNTFANLIGQGSTVVASHSIAYHYGPGGPSGWALWSNNDISTGNQKEEIVGDIYYNKTYSPQSSGHAGLCADTYVDSSGITAGGHIVLGATAVGTANTVAWNHPCPPGIDSVSGGEMDAQALANTCPAPSTWSSSNCVVTPDLSAPPVPSPAPTTAGTVVNGVTVGGGNVCSPSSVTRPGVYTVDGNLCGSPAITFNGVVNLPCVSFILTHGAEVDFTGNGPINVSSYGSAYSTMPVAAEPAPPPLPSPPATHCPGFNNNTNNNNQSIFWSAPGEATSVVLKASQGGNCSQQTCPTYRFFGIFYLPGDANQPSDCNNNADNGNADTQSNVEIQIYGQAIVNEWCDQSGDHPNIAIQYVAQDAPAIIEVDKLVE
jgi:Flp pilus assembly protein TadG